MSSRAQGQLRGLHGCAGQTRSVAVGGQGKGGGGVGGGGACGGGAAAAEPVGQAAAEPGEAEDDVLDGPFCVKIGGYSEKTPPIVRGSRSTRDAKV